MTRRHKKAPWAMHQIETYLPIRHPQAANPNMLINGNSSVRHCTISTARWGHSCDVGQYSGTELIFAVYRHDMPLWCYFSVSYFLVHLKLLSISANNPPVVDNLCMPQHNPENICNIESIVSRFEGHHSMLEAELEKKYGAKLKSYVHRAPNSSRATDACSNGTHVGYVATASTAAVASKSKDRPKSERVDVDYSPSSSIRSCKGNSHHKNSRNSSDSLTVHQSSKRPPLHGTHAESTALARSTPSTGAAAVSASAVALEEAARAEEVAELSRKVRLLKVRRHNLDVAKQIAIAKSALREGQLTKLRRDSAASSLRASANSSLVPSASSSRCVSPALSLAAHEEEDEEAVKKTLPPAPSTKDKRTTLDNALTNSITPSHGTQTPLQLLYQGTSPAALIASPALEWPSTDSPERPSSHPGASSNMLIESAEATKNKILGLTGADSSLSKLAAAPLLPGALAEAKHPPTTPTQNVEETGSSASSTGSGGGGGGSGLSFTATPVALRPLEARLEAKKANLNKVPLVYFQLYFTPAALIPSALLPVSFESHMMYGARE